MPHATAPARSPRGVPGGPAAPAPARGAVLVTGAAGFIGSHLAQRLLNENDTVLGLDALTDYYPRAVKLANLAALTPFPHFTFVEADLRTADLGALLRKHHVRAVLHQAGQAGVRPSWGKEFVPYVERNILATQAILEACVSLPDPSQIEKFVFASSSSVYGEPEHLPTGEDETPRPISPYGVTKLAAEHLCALYARERGLPVIALRYFSVYGPRQRPDMAIHLFVEALLRGQPIRVYGDGEQTRELTYVDDIVAANLLALQVDVPRGTRARVYNIGGGSQATLNAILELLGEMAATAPRLEYVARAVGDHRNGAADTTRARAELGYAPRVTLEDGLRRQFDWQRQRMEERQSAREPQHVAPAG